MARLPSVIDLGSRQTPAPTSGVVQYRPVTGNETAMGEAVSFVGRSVGHAGEVMLKAQEIQEEKEASVEAQAALNRVREKQVEYSMGEKGYIHRTGESAATKPLVQEYTGLFKTDIDAIASGLSPKAREKFDLHVTVPMLQFQEGVVRHKVQETKTYGANVFKSTLDNLERVAAVNWRDVGVIQSQSLLIEAAVSQRARDEGWSEDMRKDVLADRLGKLNTTVIGNAIANGDVKYAEEFFKANKDSIEPRAAQALFSTIKREGERLEMSGFRLEIGKNENNPKALADIQKRIESSSLPGDAQNQLSLIVANKQAAYEARARAAAERAERQMLRALGDVRDMTLRGLPPSPQQIEQLGAIPKNSPVYAEAQNVIAVSREVAGFNQLPTMEQDARIAQWGTAVRANPTKRGYEVFDALRTIRNSQNDAAIKDPVGLGMDLGVIPQQPINIDQPLQSVEGLASRVTNSAVFARSRGVDQQIMRPSEMARVGQILKGMDPPKQAAYLAEWQQALSAVGQPDAFGTLMKQLSKDSVPLATAGSFAAKGRPLIAARILEGDTLLDKNAVTVPTDSTMRKVFDDKTAGAFTSAPEFGAATYKTAKALYAFYSSKSGTKDPSVLDTDLWKQAIKEATGGIEEYNSKRTLMPYNMPFSDFRDRVSQRTTEVIAEGRVISGITKNDLLRMPVVPVDDGVYAYTTGGGEYVQDAKTGKRLEIRVNDPGMTVTPNNPPFGEMSNKWGMPGMPDFKPEIPK